MADNFDEIIKNFSNDILKDQFSQLCYDIFLTNDKGKTLMAQMFANYVNKPFLDVRDMTPKYDEKEIMVKVAWRDFVQRLLLRAQAYESALKQTKGE